MSYTAQQKEIFESDARIEDFHPDDCAPYMAQPLYELSPTKESLSELQATRGQLRADIGESLTALLDDDACAHFPRREMD